MAIDLTLTDFVEVYPEFRETTEAIFAHALGLAEIEVNVATFGEQKGRAAMIELVADYLGPAPGPNETTPRVGGGLTPHRLRFTQIRASLGPFMDLV